MMLLQVVIRRPSVRGLIIPAGQCTSWRRGWGTVPPLPLYLSVICDAIVRAPLLPMCPL
jgi:hypothetical protein